MEVEFKLDAALEDVRVIVCAPEATPEIEALLERLTASNLDLLMGFREGEAVPLDISRILRFYGEEKEVRAQTAEGSYTVRLRLYELERRLDRRFVRISVSEIVNLRQVTALDLSLTGTIRMTLTGGTVCYVSRRYVKKIKEALGL